MKVLRGRGGFERRSDERCGNNALMGWKRKEEENEGKSTSPPGMFCLPLRLLAWTLMPGDRSIYVDVIVRWESTRIWPRPFQWLCPRLGQSNAHRTLTKRELTTWRRKRECHFSGRENDVRPVSVP